MITATKITVSEILSLVRGKIFDSSDQDTLSNSKYFEQMCCALDTVGDTEMAISAYRCNKLGEDVSSKYLAVTTPFSSTIKMASFDSSKS